MDLSDNKQPDLYASSTIPCIAALLCVVLRFWCRWSQRAGFWIDDWLIVVGLACAIGLSATLLWWIPRGLGRHVQTFGPNVKVDLAIALFTCELTYTGVIVFVKFSILALYWRIFNKTSIKLPIVIVASAVFMWGLAVFLLTLLQCIPTQGYWDKTIDASCNIDSQNFLFAISIPNILIDVAILTLPIPYIRNLHVSKSQKRAIASIFLLGGFVCIASIMRLVAVATEKTDADMTWNLINQAIWAATEAGFAVISACLPTLRPVWLAIRPRELISRMSKPSSEDPSASSRPSQRVKASWRMSILSTRASNEEDTDPFSAAHNVTSESLCGPESLPDRQSNEHRKSMA
ncbi:putative Integral membrane protein [Seiridium cardinale]|uniref:Integral membrane protein n=1 Tax=Seiridium cardinale TaxID=138064 RepID=A0ABR2X7D5_9PEZI